MDGASIEIEESISTVLPALPGALGATIVFAGVNELAAILADSIQLTLHAQHFRSGGLQRSVKVKPARVRRKRGYTWPGPAQVVMGDREAPYGLAFERWSERKGLYAGGFLQRQVDVIDNPAGRSRMAAAMRRQTHSLVRKLRGAERWRSGERRLAALDLDFH